LKKKIDLRMKLKNLQKKLQIKKIMTNTQIYSTRTKILNAKHEFILNVKYEFREMKGESILNVKYEFREMKGKEGK